MKNYLIPILLMSVVLQSELAQAESRCNIVGTILPGQTYAQICENKYSCIKIPSDYKYKSRIELNDADYVILEFSPTGMAYDIHYYLKDPKSEELQNIKLKFLSYIKSQAKNEDSIISIDEAKYYFHKETKSSAYSLFERGDFVEAIFIDVSKAANAYRKALKQEGTLQIKPLKGQNVILGLSRKSDIKSIKNCSSFAETFERSIDGNNNPQWDQLTCFNDKGDYLVNYTIGANGYILGASYDSGYPLSNIDLRHSSLEEVQFTDELSANYLGKELGEVTYSPHGNAIFGGHYSKNGRVGWSFCADIFNYEDVRLRLFLDAKKSLDKKRLLDKNGFVAP